MVIVPAVDIKGGRCVRLLRGRPQEELLSLPDPLRVARGWERQGAEWLHLVDLDGAMSGQPVNAELILEIARSLRIPVEVGGGIRTESHLERYLEGGVRRVILGTAALQDPELLEQACRRWPGRIVVAVECRGGRLVHSGWTKDSRGDPLEFALRAEARGAGAVLFTDADRDGTLQGPNLELTGRLCRLLRVPLIASGGVATLGQLRALRRTGAWGVILGRALYEGRLTLREAMEVVR